MRIRTTIRNLAAVACTALPLASLARSAIGADLVPLHSGFDRLAPEAVRSGKGCFQVTAHPPCLR